MQKDSHAKQNMATVVDWETLSIDSRVVGQGLETFVTGGLAWFT